MTDNPKGWTHVDCGGGRVVLLPEITWAENHKLIEPLTRWQRVKAALFDAFGHAEMWP